MTKLLLGGLFGLAWATGLRGLMAEVADWQSTVSWGATFGLILFPAVVVGVLLAWAEHLRTTGGRPRWRWLALAPLALALAGPGALGVAVIGMAGGFSLSKRGPVWARIACGLVPLSMVPFWALAATTIGGPRLAVDTPRGVWVALYFYSFIAALVCACAIPHRTVEPIATAPLAGTPAVNP